MPGYEPRYTSRIKRANVIIRLNRETTRFLVGRIEDAVNRGTGVNLVLMNYRGAVSLVYSPEEGDQVKFIAFGPGTPVMSPMKGYNGQWSHVEIAVDPGEAAPVMEELR